MKRFKLVPIEPLPRKFAPGDRVKVTEEASHLGWIKPGKVVSCGVHTVEVLMDGEGRSANYSIDFWEPE